MGQRELSSCGGFPRVTDHGFTLVETMIAMAISVVVLLANLYLFNNAHATMARGRSISAATNLATGKIADFRAMTITEINAAAPTVAGGVRSGTDTVAVEGTPFTRTWQVSSIDLDPTAAPAADLVGSLVKIRVDVAWTAEKKVHQVVIATLTTGKSP